MVSPKSAGQEATERVLGPEPRLRSPPPRAAAAGRGDPVSCWAPRPLDPEAPGWRCPRSPPARWSSSSSDCRSAPGTGSSRLRPPPRCGRAPRALWCPWQGGGPAAASGEAAGPTGEPPTPFPHGGRATAPVGSRVAARSAAGAGPAKPTGSPPTLAARHGVGPRKWQLGRPCQWWSRLQEARGLLAAIWPGAGPAHGPRRAGARAREGLVPRQALERAQRESKTVRACVLRRGETENFLRYLVLQRYAGRRSTKTDDNDR
jgi:hypothetical protein